MYVYFFQHSPICPQGAPPDILPLSLDGNYTGVMLQAVITRGAPLCYTPDGALSSCCCLVEEHCGQAPSCPYDSYVGQYFEDYPYPGYYWSLMPSTPEDSTPPLYPADKQTVIKAQCYQFVIYPLCQLSITLSITCIAQPLFTFLHLEKQTLISSRTTFFNISNYIILIF